MLWVCSAERRQNLDAAGELPQSDPKYQMLVFKDTLRTVWDFRAQHHISVITSG